jgi:hypothetical protein
LLLRGRENSIDSKEVRKAWTLAFFVTLKSLFQGDVHSYWKAKVSREKLMQNSTLKQRLEPLKDLIRVSYFTIFEIHTIDGMGEKTKGDIAVFV